MPPPPPTFESAYSAWVDEDRTNAPDSWSSPSERPRLFGSPEDERERMRFFEGPARWPPSAVSAKPGEQSRSEQQQDFLDTFAEPGDAGLLPKSSSSLDSLFSPNATSTKVEEEPSTPPSHEVLSSGPISTPNFSPLSAGLSSLSSGGNPTSAFGGGPSSTVPSEEDVGKLDNSSEEGEPELSRDEDLGDMNYQNSNLSSKKRKRGNQVGRRWTSQSKRARLDDFGTESDPLKHIGKTQMFGSHRCLRCQKVNIPCWIAKAGRKSKCFGCGKHECSLSRHKPNPPSDPVAGKTGKNKDKGGKAMFKECREVEKAVTGLQIMVEIMRDGNGGQMVYARQIEKIVEGLDKFMKANEDRWT
ncbi:hypothetical protein P7C73_g945, partial [Tremellales sp. Uapishka_1]